MYTTATLPATLPENFTEDQWEAKRLEVIDSLEILLEMLKADEIGFEWYSHDAQLVLKSIGWEEVK